jgi:hypothetical protein
VAALASQEKNNNMTQTLLSDLIIPEVFDKYVLVKTTELSRFRQSGILVDLTAELMPQMGGVTVNMPFFNDLTGSDDVMTVNNVTSGIDVAVKLGRAKAFGASDLSADLSGADPMAVIANRFAAFWVRAEQHILLSAVAGQIGKVTEDVLDITGLTGSAANFDPHSFIDACGLLGDHQDALAGIVVHSDTYKAMKKQDLIDFIKPSTLEEEVPVYQGKFVLVDDTMPKSNGVYDTYIFGPGAIGYATASPRRPVELERRKELSMPAYADKDDVLARYEQDTIDRICLSSDRFSKLCSRGASVIQNTLPRRSSAPFLLAVHCAPRLRRSTAPHAVRCDAISRR